MVRRPSRYPLSSILYPRSSARLRLLLAEQRIDKPWRIKRLDILRRFAEAYELYRDVERVLNGDDNAALGGAVELGQHDSGDVNGRAEILGLQHRVLPGGRV